MKQTTKKIKTLISSKNDSIRCCCYDQVDQLLQMMKALREVAFQSIGFGLQYVRMKKEE
jgi:hypothetical protein